MKPIPTIILALLLVITGVIQIRKNKMVDDQYVTIDVKEGCLFALILLLITILLLGC